MAESRFATVVGYKENVITNGSQGVGLAFFKIGAPGKMSDLEVTGYQAKCPMEEGGYGFFGFMGRQLKDSGKAIKEMFWVDTPEEWDESDYYPPLRGWYDNAGEACYNDDPLVPGVGLWFTFVNVDNIFDETDVISIRSAGEVLTDAGGYSQILTNGSQLVANPTPVTLKMKQIHVTGYEEIFPEEDGGYGLMGIMSRQLKDSGKAIKEMFWVDTPEEWDESDYYPPLYGWYDNAGEECYNNDTLASGAALWITLTDVDSMGLTSCTLVWPSALDK